MRNPRASRVTTSLPAVNFGLFWLYYCIFSLCVDRCHSLWLSIHSAICSTFGWSRLVQTCLQYWDLKYNWSCVISWQIFSILLLQRRLINAVTFEYRCNIVSPHGMWIAPKAIRSNGPAGYFRRGQGAWMTHSYVIYVQQTSTSCHVPPRLNIFALCHRSQTINLVIRFCFPAL